MLKDKESFTIIICEDETEEEKMIDTVEKISLRKQIKYNRVKLKYTTEYSYILYSEPKDKKYIFDMARNKKLKIVWKDNDFFGIIDFKNNTKGDIVCYLENNNCNNEEKIEGKIIYLNLKPEYKGREIMLISKIVLDEENPYKYDYFCFYKMTNE